MNKKAGEFLGSQITGIIVAVAILFGLSYFIFRLVYSHPELTAEKRNAIEFIDGFKAKMDAIPQSSEGSVQVQGFDPQDLWYIAGWSEDSPTAPDRCFFQSCMCVCKAESSNNLNLKSDCQAGYCVPVASKEFAITSKYTYTITPQNPNVIPGRIPSEGLKPKDYSFSVIFVKNTLLDIRVQKSQDSINLSLK